MSADRLGPVFERFRVQAATFQAGPLCGISHYSAERGLGFFHVLRNGQMEVTHEGADGLPRSVILSEPSLLFYPRPLSHGFINPPVNGSELMCATLRFEGGAAHPLAHALPPLVRVPLAELTPMEHTLALLFGEADNARRGQRLLADRLFEVLLIQLLRWLLEHPERYPLSPGLLAGLAHPQLAGALVAIHKQPAQAWSLDSLAECAGMSRSRFAETFRREVGETPAEHLAQWRLALAKQRLMRGEGVKRVAEAVGYGSASALSRAFAARVGQSPQHWLRAQAAATAGS
jgi:AraC-like DNA-binding protein